MQQSLENKLRATDPYTDSELLWALSHPSPDIRDQLIYASFCHGFEQELISSEQFELITKYLIQKITSFNRYPNSLILSLVSQPHSIL